VTPVELSPPMGGRRLGRMKDPKKHHYIPVFYLKSWAGDDQRLVEFSRVGPKKKLYRRRCFPTQTGFREHLYTLEDVSEETRSWFESVFLQYVDDLSAKAMRQFLCGADGQITVHLRDAWSRFIMSTIHRNPEKISEISRVFREGYDQITHDLENRYDALRFPTDPPDYQAYLASRKPGTQEIARANLLKKLMDSEFIGTSLNKMEWSVWGFEHTQRTLMTSDRPIVIPKGLAHDDSYVGIAISPRHMFVACNNPSLFATIRRTTGDEKLVGIHNDAVARQAADYVYAVDYSQATFVNNRLGLQPPQFLGWRPGHYVPPGKGIDVTDGILDRLLRKA
jgi:hypothetical protein